jgi:hypothetical protein
VARQWRLDVRDATDERLQPARDARGGKLILFCP